MLCNIISKLILSLNLSSVSYSLSILLCCLLFGDAQANLGWQNERELYKKARTSLSKHQINQFNQYLIQLTEYPLYPYLVYEELRKRISGLTNEEVDAFLRENSDGQLAKRLRMAWLSQLLRKDHSESFLKYYQNESSPNLQCYFLHAKIRHNQFEENKDQHLNQIRDLWLVGKSQPAQCDPLFKWYEEQGHLTTEQIWERFSLVMDENNSSLANYLAKNPS